METSDFLKLYLVSIPIFLILDLFWLGIVSQNFYQSQIGHLLGVSLLPTIVFYAVFLVGLTIFATMPGTMNDGWQSAFLLGALFGFFAYATYNLANLATLQDWSLHLAVVNIAWGTFLSAATAGLTGIAVSNYS